MINHINLKAFRGSITDFTKINYINQQAAKGLCIYLTKFWRITTTKNYFALALTIQNHDKNTTPDSVSLHYEFKKVDGTISSNTRDQRKVSSITIGSETVDGFENRDGFSYYAYSASFSIPSAFTDYTITVTFELDGKEYVLTETGNIYDEYKLSIENIR